MIIESIHLTNFLSHAESTIDFTEAPLWLIWGENGAGKSALFDGVEYALYGKHRGGTQGSHLLVKHDAPEAVVEVVFRLNGRRYRVKHHIPAKDGGRTKGRKAGYLAEWDSTTNDWVPRNVGEGTQGVWKWLERRLPSHDLFRSAVFLRQSDTAHFFSGYVKDRIERFGALLDLSAYTRLSERARVRQRDAEQRQRDAKARLNEQGDVSDEAEARLQEQIQEAEENLVEAAEKVREASAVREGAQKWAELTGRRIKAEERREHFQGLLANEATIREADAKVKTWDAAAVRLHAYWEARGRADQQRRNAEKWREKRAKDEEAAREKQALLDEALARVSAINDKELPEARAQFAAAGDQVRNLGLEAQIAEACTKVMNSAEAAHKLEGKDRELEEWQDRHAALPRVESFLQARAYFASATKTRMKAERALEDARHQATEAGKELDRARAAAQEAQAALDRAITYADDVRSQYDQLSGRIKSHGTLTGAEVACPVCDQPLDDAAHEHVRAILAEELDQLKRLQADLIEAEETKTATEQTLREATKSLQNANTTFRLMKQAVDVAEGHLKKAQEDEKRAEETLEKTRNAVDQLEYTAVLDQITDEWLETEKRRVASGLQVAKEAAAALAQARNTLSGATAQLETLRGQRAPSAEPLGETLSKNELEARKQAVLELMRQHEKAIRDLERDIRELQSDIQQLSGDVAALLASAGAAREQAEQADREATAADLEANHLAVELGNAWVGVLASREEYETERAVVDSQRETAALLTELLEARGKLEQVNDELERINADMEQIAPAHRISPEQADDQEKAARRIEREAIEKKTVLKGQLADLKERRAKAEMYRRVMGETTAEAEVWYELAELLKEGGPIQAEVVTREQARIVAEVNSVLKRLGDSLRVTLGESRRQQSVKIQDIHIVDTADPSHAPRFFEFLSGGEQFRVALALALALHRRVAKDRAGTLIVDEGFGALDSQRRDALAREMANTSQGILRLGLAENIILCSHSEEVKNRFPFRWVIEKQGGTATVQRFTDNGEGGE